MLNGAKKTFGSSTAFFSWVTIVGKLVLDGIVGGVLGSAVDLIPWELVLSVCGFFAGKEGLGKLGPAIEAFAKRGGK